MLEKLLEFLAHLKGGAAAGIFVVGATGVLITGTVVNGDVRVHVTPAIAAAAAPGPGPATSEDDEDEDNKESAACVEAVRVRDQALRAVAAEKEKALTDLQTLKEIASSLARRANKDLPDETLTATQRAIALELERIGTEAARATRQVLDLAPCEDGNPTTGLVVDLADLRQRYRVIVDLTQQQLRSALQRAAEALEKLVRDAPIKPQQQESDASGGSDDSSD